MSDSSDQSNPLDYSTQRPRLSWKSYWLGVFTFPVAYLGLYLILRLTGVYYAYYSKGSWEIDGGTRIELIDIMYFPIAIKEAELQNYLRWLPEPKGG